jgi:hypothetical protein
MYGCENGWPGAAQNYLGVLGAWPWSVFPAYLQNGSKPSMFTSYNSPSIFFNLPFL